MDIKPKQIMDSDLSSKTNFQSLTYGSVSWGKIINIIKEYLEESPESMYSLVIGTDSQEKLEQSTGKKYIHLVTAIVVYRHGYGGKYFWSKKKINNVHSLREKVYAETSASLEFAAEFVPVLQKSLNGKMPNYRLEIHVDVGEHGET